MRNMGEEETVACESWRRVDDFSNGGNIDISTLASLTPRMKVLREMERLAMVAHEGLDDLRHKLVTYRCGDFWVPTGGVEKQDLDLPPIVTLILLGMSGSGKSSLVNLMYSVLGRSGLIPFAQTSTDANYTSLYMEEHNVLRSMRSGFCVYDSRGLDMSRMGECLDQVSAWMLHGVRHYQRCSRSSDALLSARDMSSARRFRARRVNCAMVVANLAHVHAAFQTGDKKPLQAISHLFHCTAITKSNENPILILTHGDLLAPEDRMNGRLKICEYLGIPETTGAYDIACLTEQGILADAVTAFAVTEAVYRALMQSDRTHLPKKKAVDWVAIFLSWIMCSIRAVFAMIGNFFLKMSNKKQI